jgi:signal transduction histidine kinase
MATRSLDTAHRRFRFVRERDWRTVRDELKAAQRRVAAAADDERRRIARDLHDGAQQRLMAVRLQLGLLAERAGDGRAVTHRDLERLRTDVEQALEEIRRLAHGLHPPLLASDGLHAALAAASRRAPIPVEIDGTTTARFARPIENAAYFCCAEALQNVVKHAGAGARASIHLEVRRGALEFRITDDGCGFDGRRDGEGHGLTNLRDRLSAVGGHAEITSIPGCGTTVVGQIPLG